jgi:hypothetical protein
MIVSNTCTKWHLLLVWHCHSAPFQPRVRVLFSNDCVIQVEAPIVSGFLSCDAQVGHVCQALSNMVNLWLPNLSYWVLQYSRIFSSPEWNPSAKQPLTQTRQRILWPMFGSPWSLWFIDSENEIFTKTDCCFSFICYIFNLYFKTLIKLTQLFSEMWNCLRCETGRMWFLVSEGRKWLPGYTDSFALLESLDQSNCLRS